MIRISWKLLQSLEFLLLNNYCVKKDVFLYAIKKFYIETRLRTSKKTKDTSLQTQWINDIRIFCLFIFLITIVSKITKRNIFRLKISMEWNPKTCQVIKNKSTRVITWINFINKLSPRRNTIFSPSNIRNQPPLKILAPLLLDKARVFKKHTKQRYDHRNRFQYLRSNILITSSQ